MLQPKKVKYRKMQKGRMRGKAQRGSSVAFGEFGLQATDRARLTARQIEAARIAMTRHVKRGGKIWIRIFPDKPITKKPAETRMGKGKGNPEDWVAVVQAGSDPLRDGGRRPDDRRARRCASRRTSCPCRHASCSGRKSDEGVRAPTALDR